MSKLTTYLLSRLKKFKKDERSSFPYWFNHLLAFNILAIQFGAWKFKYLFHDFEKPWLKLVWPYKKVQQWHRKHANHHIQYEGPEENYDWEAMVIDWECSRFTKSEAQLNAVDTMELEAKGLEPGINRYQASWLVNHMYPVLEKFGLVENK